MLILRARLQHQGSLRNGGVQQSGLLSDFQTARDPSCVALVQQVQSLPLISHRFLDDLVFRIEFAQGEIVGGEFGSQNQLHIPEIRRRRLQRSIRCFHILAHPSEQIGFVAQ